MASAEVAPFARVGGLSDVAGALAKELAGMGHEVAVFLPRYASIDGEAYGIREVEGLGPLSVPMGDHDEEVTLYEGRMPGAESVAVYFIGHEGYFGREGIYVDPATGEGYPDEPLRYALFSRALVLAMREVAPRPDAVHLNDHHTAMVAAYLQEFHDEDARIGKPGIIFSIHNLGYQGLFDRKLLPEIGLPQELGIPGSPFEFHGSVSSLKVGIELADFVNTVSERYALEISSTPEYGLGLEEVLAERRADGRLVGILNGVDYSVWDPRVDELIPENYAPGDLMGKTTCKQALLERSGLDGDTSTPLIGIVSRLADQKGFDLLREAAGSILELGANFVILGTGQQEYHEFLQGMSERHPKRVAAHLTFDNQLAHWIEAGSDMFLMPSRYEPCGLNQMYSLRYGTVPIVRSTGGLADTVEDYEPASDEGTGFVFQDYTAVAMLSAVARAVKAHGEARAWAGLMARGMALDYSWRASAAKYAGLYERAREAAPSRRSRRLAS